MSRLRSHFREDDHLRIGEIGERVDGDVLSAPDADGAPASNSASNARLIRAFHTARTPSSGTGSGRSTKTYTSATLPPARRHDRGKRQRRFRDLGERTSIL